MIQEITQQRAVESALDSLLAGRMAILIGAGLSMAPPSSLPSAAALARGAKEKYDATYGGTRDPLPSDIEEQASFFFRRRELGTMYLRSLIDRNAFAGDPNPGHYAVADLLLIRAIQVGITTNIDILVEMAAQRLRGHVEAGIDVAAVAAVYPDCSPLLKIHGCRNANFDETVWTREQIAHPPLDNRIADCARWLGTQLLDRDLLIVGFWTDWAYLNQVLETGLGAVRPAKVTIVDPAPTAELRIKAPGLHALGERARVEFHHVRISGSDFLDALRKQFSQTFVRRILTSAVVAYGDATGHPPAGTWTEPPDTDNEALWQMRRDLEGRLPTEPAKDREPTAGPLLGLTLLQLRTRGATADGPHWLLNGARVRVIKADGKFLHRVEEEYCRETAPILAPEFVIAVGAEDANLPRDVVRGGQDDGSIARAAASQWLTRLQAVERLHL